MIRDILSSIDGIEIYPVVGLVIFVLFFAACIVWVVKIDRSYIDKMRHLPLKSDETINDFKGNKNE